ncbi:MAG: FtsL-like putative cell division protein [Croceimicrobium sp.]|nr:FtsL-like putative cell division protein [Bacteroidota bacterium]
MTEPKLNTGKRLSTLLTGRFLLSPRVLKHWPFIVFLCALALIMTASSHSAERKVHRIATLRTEMKELHSQFIDTRSSLMKQSMQSKVLTRVEEAGLKLRKNELPPLIIKKQEDE